MWKLGKYYGNKIKQIVAIIIVFTSSLRFDHSVAIHFEVKSLSMEVFNGNLLQHVWGRVFHIKKGGLTIKSTISTALSYRNEKWWRVFKTHKVIQMLKCNCIMQCKKNKLKLHCIIIMQGKNRNRRLCDPCTLVNDEFKFISTIF